MPNVIISHKQEGILTITLNRPEKLNCINWQMLQELKNLLLEAEHDTQVRAICIRGEGSRAFSTGADLKEFGALTSDQVQQWIRYGNEVFNLLEELPKPTLAIVQGYALGGGLELALACDFRIGTHSATFGFPEVGNGWIPGWGGMTRLKALLGMARAKEMVFLSDRISAQQAYQYGLINFLTDEAGLEEMVLAVVNKLTQLDARVFGFAKAALNDPARTTRGADLLFDIIATEYSVNKKM
jgi:enoyl-CoA hydratase/carnithine racemase